MNKYFFTNRLRQVLLVSAVGFLLGACAVPQAQDPVSEQKLDVKEVVSKLDLKEAVSSLGKNLRIQLTETLQKEEGPAQPTQFIVIDPIISIESGYQFKANQQVVSNLARELGSGFKLDELSPDNLTKAKYVLSGAISQRADVLEGTQSGCQLVITILELSSGAIKAKGQASINGFQFEPSTFYEDSPLFLQDKSFRLAKLLFGWSVGQPASQEYIEFLPAKATIQQGIIAYDLEQFANAASWFSKAVALPTGKTLPAYAGLYLSSQKLRREANANKAFTNLLTLAIAENRKLDLKLQFNTSLPAFIPNPELAKRYAGWLKNIAQFMQKNNLCLNISAHSSRSADASETERLSLSRSKTIQGVMAATFPGIIKKSQVVGKGFQDNIIGNSANDASDAVDRRVELSVIDCNELQKSTAN